jgi:hypothetical protein
MGQIAPPEQKPTIAARPFAVRSTGVERREEAKPVNLGPQIGKVHGVTSPQWDFV